MPKNPFLVLGNSEFAYPHEPCEEISEKEVICKHLEWQKLQNSEDCIAQLIQHQEPHNCTYATAILENNKINQIKDNSWIAIIKKEEVIKTTCGEEVEYKRSKGVFLITVDNNCQIHLMGKTLQTHRKYINVKETIPLPRVHETTQSLPLRINLENIELDNIKDIIQKTQALQDIPDRFETITTTPSWLSIMLYVILTIALAGAIYRKLWQKYKSRRTMNIEDIENGQQVEDTQQQPLSSSVRLSLKGGGVM